jgi:hypothetical protein
MVSSGAVETIKAMSAQNAPFIPDEPVSAEEDAFGHDDYSRAIASIVSDPSPPSTLGVFGPWGVGKSSIVKGVEDHLDAKTCSFVYFDAWKYEGDSLRRQFLVDVTGQLERAEVLDKCKFSSEKSLRELDVDEQHTEEAFSLLSGPSRLCCCSRRHGRTGLSTTPSGRGLLQLPSRL